MDVSCTMNTILTLQQTFCRLHIKITCSVIFWYINYLFDLWHCMFPKYNKCLGIGICLYVVLLKLVERRVLGII